MFGFVFRAFESPILSCIVVVFIYIVLAVLAIPFFNIFIAVPLLALVPAALVAGCYVRHRRALDPQSSARVLLAVIVWVGYTVYELRVSAWAETVDTPIRADLLLIAPLASIALFVATRTCWRVDHEGRRRPE